MDQIIIENLQVFAHHGVYAEENEKGQNFYINAVLETDTRKAGILDDLSLSVDYGAVCRFLNEFLTEHTYKLIETAAERASEALLLAFVQVRGVTLEIRKPEAPIPLTFESVSVKISRRWKKAYLGCGSNMGNRSQNLSEAVAALRLDEKCRVLKVSDWIDTTPYGGVEQRNFLNGAIAIETLYTPEELLERLHEIEKAGGRVRKVHWGPRTIDLDILLYEDCIMSTDTLTIPHNDMTNRDFVLAPLAQIAPYAVHPILHQSVQQMYGEVKKHGEKHYWLAEEFDAGLGI
jgi:dihydroneopterin aldolase/2-amino-4-hydroxy-6-hydroxymethyldihydropteridine diphosphokinase